MKPGHWPLILASGSQTRQRLLTAASIEFAVEIAGIDEEAIKAKMYGQGVSKGARARDLALRLAKEKALAVSLTCPDALIIGCDQVLDCEGTWFSKPADTSELRSHLAHLRNRTHSLETAIVLCSAGETVWQHVETPKLTMRDFSDGFLEKYTNQVGADVLSSVGGYHLEGLGLQLFDNVDGDYFSVLGLPLIPLLAKLRELGAVPT